MASKPVPCEKGASLRRAFLLHVEGQVTEGEDCATTFHDPFPCDVSFKPLTSACARTLAVPDASGKSRGGLGSSRPLEGLAKGSNDARSDVVPDEIRGACLSIDPTGGDALLLDASAQRRATSHTPGLGIVPTIKHCSSA